MGGFFCPIGVIKPIPGTRLPECIELEAEKLDQVELKNWPAIKKKVIKLFCDAKTSTKSSARWHKHGKQNGIERFKCVQCKKVVPDDARDDHVCQ